MAHREERGLQVADGALVLAFALEEARAHATGRTIKWPKRAATSSTKRAGHLGEV